jgi:hypothetical protein
LVELGEMFVKLEQAGGMKIYKLLELLDDEITVEVSAGEWKGRAYLRLHNFNKIFIELTKTINPVEDE